MTLSLVICERCGAVLNGITESTEDELLEDLATGLSLSLEEQRERFADFADERRGIHATSCPGTRSATVVA